MPWQLAIFRHVYLIFILFRIFEASTKGHSINYIIAPSTIYGVGTENPVHKLSAQIPHLIRLAIQRKQAVYGGEGMFSHCDLRCIPPVTQRAARVRTETPPATQKLDDVGVLMTFFFGLPFSSPYSPRVVDTMAYQQKKKTLIIILRNESMEQRAHTRSRGTLFDRSG